MVLRSVIHRFSYPTCIVLLALYLALAEALFGVPALAQAAPSTPAPRLYLPLALRALSGSPTATATATQILAATATPTATPTVTPSPTPTLPPGGPSSNQLIDQALARGEISSETALVYKVYVAYADPRLPAQYRGDDRALWESAIMDQVTARFAALSPATQNLLQPFLVPPLYTDSWFGQRSGAAAARPAAPPPPCSSAITGWQALDTANGKARVWYFAAADQAKALTVAQALNNGWTSLSSLLGREPLSDAGKQCNGGDGRLDLYLTPATLLPSGDTLGLASPYVGTDCNKAPIWLQVRRSLAGQELEATTYHELMHAFQRAYQVGSACQYPEYHWLKEATADWAIDRVDADNDAEHDSAPDFLDRPELPLEYVDGVSIHEYGAYLYFFFLARKYTPTYVSLVWNTAETTSSSLKAANDGVPGGFAARWPEFALRDWNQTPVTDHPEWGNYKEWDGLTDHVPEFNRSAVMSGEAGQTLLALPEVEGMEHLSAQYFHIRFDDPDVHRVTLYNGLGYKLSQETVTAGSGVSGPSSPFETLVWRSIPPEAKKGVSIQALVKIDGAWQGPLDWTYQPYVTYCRDKKGQASEHVEEMILIVGNSVWDDTAYTLQPVDQPPTLLLSNIGCEKWQGTLHSEFRSSNPEAPDTYADGGSTAPVILQASGLYEATASAGGRYVYGTRYYLPTAGAAAWHMEGEGHPNPSGCRISVDRVPNPGISDTVRFGIIDFALAGLGARRYILWVDSYGPTTDTCGQPAVLQFTHTWVDWNDAFPPSGGCYPFTVFRGANFKVAADNALAIAGTVSQSGGCSVTYGWSLASAP